MDEMQSTLDGLAEALGRSICVEEPRFRPLAVSAHYGVVDQARVNSLLNRRTDPRLTAYFRPFRIDAATEPVRIEGNAELDLLPRLVVPIRQHGRLLGHLWLIDADPPITAAEMPQIKKAASTIGQLLWNRVQDVDRDIAAESAMLSDLLEGGLPHRQSTLERLLTSRGLPIDTTLVAVNSARVDSQHDEVEDTEEAVRLLLTDTRFARGPYALIGTTLRDRFVALSPARPTATQTYHQLARILRAAAARYDIELGGIGIGSAIAGARDIPVSVQHASYAARVAERCPEESGVAQWDDLGYLRMFATVPWDASGVDLLHPGLSRLLNGTKSLMAETVLAYLDTGGDAQATAQTLRIHRTTLYYRLGRAADILGIDLSKGETRMSVHAGLYLARLARLLP